MKDEWKKDICHATRYTLYSLATDYNEVTGLTKSQLMRLALAGKGLELGRGAVKMRRAPLTHDQPAENIPRTIALSRENCFRISNIR